MDSVRRSSLVLGAVFTAWVASSTPVQAGLIIDIDLDTTTTGIQSTRTVDVADVFDVHVVLTGDGVSTFDTALFDTVFNDTGSVLGVVGPPRAGMMASMAPAFFTVFDFVAFAPTFHTAPLTPAGVLPPAGFGGGTGGAGYTILGAPLLTLGLDVQATLMELTFSASTAGASTIELAGLFGGPILALGGVPVIPSSIDSARVTVSGATPAPEPSTLAVLFTGLLAGVITRRLRR